MDSNGSLGVLWRRKGLTFTLLILTLLGAACAFVILPWKYNASITETLLNSEQSSKTLGGGNPYLSFDSAMVDMANLLAVQLTNNANVLALQQNGYTASFQAQVLSENPETEEPFIQISVSGRKEESVAQTLQGAAGSLGSLLIRVQTGVPAKSRLSLQTIAEVSPVRSMSAKIKPIVGFLAVGLVLTFLIPQAVEGSAVRRRKIRTGDAVTVNDRPKPFDPGGEPERIRSKHAAETRSEAFEQQWPDQQVADVFGGQKVLPTRPGGGAPSGHEYGAPGLDDGHYSETERQWLPNANGCVFGEAFNGTQLVREGSRRDLARKYRVSVRQLAALARRHVFAVCLILLVTAGIAIDFKYTQTGYEETATVALEQEGFVSVEPVSANENFLIDSSLITTCQLLVMRLSGSQGEIQLRQAGVIGNFAVSVINSSNADYPSYPYPDFSVSVSSGSSDTTHHQFSEAMQVIAADIAEFQTGSQFSTQNRFAAYTLSDSGPISQRGSLARTYAALMFLALVASFLTCCLLDRRSRSAVAPTTS